MARSYIVTTRDRTLGQAQTIKAARRLAMLNDAWEDAIVWKGSQVAAVILAGGEILPCHAEHLRLVEPDYHRPTCPEGYIDLDALDG